LAKQRGGDLVRRRAFQHFSDGLQDQQLLFTDFCGAGFVHGEGFSTWLTLI
jgi:hypothetical protein